MKVGVRGAVSIETQVPINAISGNNSGCSQTAGRDGVSTTISGTIGASGGRSKKLAILFSSFKDITKISFCWGDKASALAAERRLQ